MSEYKGKILQVKEGVYGNYLGTGKTLFQPAYAKLVSFRVYLGANDNHNVYADVEYFEDEKLEKPIRMSDGTNQRHILLLDFKTDYDLTDELLWNIKYEIVHMKP